MEQEINKLIEKFKPLITNIILEDRKYFSFTNIPNWCFFADEDISKVAIFLKKEKLIRINLCSCEYAYSTNNFHMIEYFFLHEIRHYFQYQMVEDYQAGKETIVKKQPLKIGKRIITATFYRIIKMVVQMMNISFNQLKSMLLFIAMQQ